MQMEACTVSLCRLKMFTKIDICEMKRVLKRKLELIHHFKLKGDLVRKLKEENADNIQIQQAVRELKQRKKLLEDKVKCYILLKDNG